MGELAGTRHLLWENFSRLIQDGVPLLHPVPGVPEVWFFTTVSGECIGMFTPCHPGRNPLVSSLRDVDIAYAQRQSQPCLELSTRNRALFPEFYLFLVSVADRIQIDGVPVEQAVQEAQERWRELLRSVEVLGEERQLGLHGELWLLERLVRIRGTDTVSSWMGPLAEPHDFRWDDLEFEVKSSRSGRRSHVIHGIGQLVPTLGRRLYLLSLLFAPLAVTDLGNGATLPERVRDIRELLQSDPVSISIFEERLRAAGYRDADSIHYAVRLDLRAAPALVLVDDDCPRLIPPDLEQISTHQASRLSEIQYRVDLTGLGFEDGTEPFLTILPRPVEGASHA